jgi:hypothetical protein
MLDSSEGVYCCAFATIYASQNSLEDSTCEESGIPEFQKTPLQITLHLPLCPPLQPISTRPSPHTNAHSYLTPCPTLYAPRPETPQT